MEPVIRRRMSPTERRALILDAAATVVSGEGVTAVTFERLSADAGVSKALIYAYFRNRLNLLAELLLREYPAFHGTEVLAIEAEPGFEAVVRQTTRAYLDHVAAKGILLQRLLGEPTVAAAVANAHSRGREITAAYFGGLMARDFGIPAECATELADLLMGVTGAAGGVLFREGNDVGRLSEMVVGIIMASVGDVAKEARVH